jgi:hypothetical protein
MTTFQALMIAEFNRKTKNALGARVAYRCSYPGCTRITIGPGNDHAEHFIIVGEAAHIYAASEKGPRPNAELTKEQRSSIENGIWLCKTHARLVDVDTNNFSAQTLLLWKEQAEKETYRKMKELEKEAAADTQTLIGLRSGLICACYWKSVEEEEWVFELDHFVEGNLDQLRAFSIEIKDIPSWNKYIVIESQGDGRELQSFSWLNDKNTVQLTCQVKPKSLRTSPHEMGGDIAVGENFDIFFKDGDLASVKGMDAAIQDIRLHLSTIPGDLRENVHVGSEIVRYFEKYKDNASLLNRLLKLEIVRLLVVSIPDSFSSTLRPSFNYINRVLDATVLSINDREKSAIVKLSLEWGNMELWEGKIKLGINPNRTPIDWDSDDFWK